MAPTRKQAQLFTELLERKQFPQNSDPASLTQQFGGLSRKSASEWIDKALALPNATDAPDEGTDAPAPF